MSESKIEVEISHDGEYCGECKFLNVMPIYPNHGVCWCKAYTFTNIRTYDNKAKRCNACLEKAIPVEEKPVVMIISNPDLDPEEAEAILEYVKSKFPERFKNG